MNINPTLTVFRFAMFLTTWTLLLPTGWTTAAENPTDVLDQTGRAFSHIAKTVSPAVVFIQVEKKMTDTRAFNQRSLHNDPFDLFNDEFLRRFFGIEPRTRGRQPQEKPQTMEPREQWVPMGQGSGFIITEDGYILTNNHVVGKADRLKVTTSDKRTFEATVVGTDPQTDVAVIKIDASGLPTAGVGSSEDLQVGEWVVAIGNPFGLSHTVTAGIVSAKGRSAMGVTDYEDFIQTDAAINPGNSGGPLVNIRGEVIGINMFIISRTGGSMGIGFAIPMDLAKTIYDQIVATGKVTRGYLGIMIQELTPELAETFGVPETQGVLIAEVTADSPADKGGLQQGDIIVKLGKQDVTTVTPFRNEVALMNPGTKVKIGILRNGESLIREITIQTLRESEGSGQGNELLETLGFRVQSLTPELAERFGYAGEHGVLIAKVAQGSIAAQAGIRPGMLIQEVDRHRVANLDELKEVLESAKTKDSVLFRIREGSYSRYVALRRN